MNLPPSVLRSIPCLLASAVLAQTPAPVAPATPAAPTAKALQAEFQALAKAVFPSVVTVRSFVRLPAAANGPAALAPAAPAPTTRGASEATTAAGAWPKMDALGGADTARAA